MIKNYFIIAWRNISRHKVFTIINVLGLALGICACIVIYLVTSYDLSFDKFHPDKERIYRIVGEQQRSDGTKDFVNSPTDDVAGFQNQIPGFEVAAAFHLYGEAASIPDGNNPVKKFGGRIETQDCWSATSIITGPEYFDIFKYQWLIGNAKTALQQPFQVVLTENRARLYFGNIPLQKMIGRKIFYEDSLPVSVSGIVKDWNENTGFGYTDFISIKTATHSFLKNRIPTEDWRSLSPHRSMAFVKLAKGMTAEQVNARFTNYIKEHVKFQNPGSKLSMYLQPITDIHFSKTMNRGDDGDNFRKAYMPLLYALMGLAAFILLIAAVNFINLSTAQSVQRAKEIGLRKVLGSSKQKIVYQFLTETFVLTLLAVIVSVILVNPVLAAFSSYIPDNITFHPFQLSTILFLSAVTLVTSLLAGFYPAKVLSSYLPVLSLKGAGVQKGNDKINLRKALIVFQFTFSLVFIIAALVIGKQIRFMNNADKGFNTDAIITVSNWDDHEGKLKVFTNNCKQLPGVRNAIWQGAAPMGFAQNIDNFQFKDKEENSRQVLVDIGNRDFIPFYEMKIIAGRNMLESDSLNEFIINETYAKALGFKNPGDAVGKLLHQVFYQGEKPYPIVGVVADYHTGSLKEAIQPVVIENVPDRKASVAIKLAWDDKNKKNVKATLARIETQWKKIFPDKAFDYSFLNESINWLYEPENKTVWLVNVAMSITIFISCMGLFGLGLFTAQRRTREIGIRKVLGASVTNIAAMLSKDFVLLVLAAILIASPIAWYFMNQWLQDFAYRTNISWWVFLLAGIASVLIALVTVSFQAIKAALANPVKSLRTE
ncbi:MAG: ABC transporter permease [Bacteroidetes bacterium]|nr:ABC transporter permease [Bacteroidota bacterium]